MDSQSFGIVIAINSIISKTNISKILFFSLHHILVFLIRFFSVVALDLRGYGDTDKPEGVANYGMELLVKDLDEVITALGKEKAFVVAHDWGAVVAWFLAILKPEKVEKLVILNVPHPRAFQKFLMTTLSQFRKSWWVRKRQIAEKEKF